MKDFRKFAELHREALFAIAKKNTKYNKDGRAVISKDDPWINETEWDEHYKRLVEDEKDLSSRSMVC